MADLGRAFVLLASQSSNFGIAGLFGGPALWSVGSVPEQFKYSCCGSSNGGDDWCDDEQSQNQKRPRRAAGSMRGFRGVLMKRILPEHPPPVRKQ